MVPDVVAYSSPHQERTTLASQIRLFVGGYPIINVVDGIIAKNFKNTLVKICEQKKTAVELVHIGV